MKKWKCDGNRPCNHIATATNEKSPEISEVHFVPVQSCSAHSSSSAKALSPLNEVLYKYIVVYIFFFILLRRIGHVSSKESIESPA